MAIIRWEPFRMEDFPELRLPKFGTDLAVDVYEKGNDVIAEMNLPGVNPEDIGIDVEDDYVRINGVKEEKKENKEADYYYQEIQRGSFERAFRLPAKVNPTKATAEFEDGVLTIVMPKVEGQQAQKVKAIRRAEKPEPKTSQPKTTAAKQQTKKAPAKKKAK